MATTDDLWGGQLVGIEFDPVSHSCDLHVSTVLDGVATTYTVVCRGVSELRFHNAIPEPWTYAEVTEAHLGIDAAAGRQVLELILWSEGSDLVVTCVSVDVAEVRR